ncbi:unnamed protein product, partial [Gulo gulo]
IPRVRSHTVLCFWSKIAGPAAGWGKARLGFQGESFRRMGNNQGRGKVQSPTPCLVWGPRGGKLCCVAGAGGVCLKWLLEKRKTWGVAQGTCQHQQEGSGENNKIQLTRQESGLVAGAWWEVEGDGGVLLA